MAIRGTPEEIAKKWATRASAASADYTAGVQRVTESPGAKAAAKSGKWRQAVTQAEDKFRTNVGRVSLESWKQSTTTIGAGRFADGVTKKQNKMADFQRDVRPHMEAGLRQLDAMPDTSIEDRINKSAAWQRHMAAFRRGSGI